MKYFSFDVCHGGHLIDLADELAVGFTELDVGLATTVGIDGEEDDDEQHDDGRDDQLQLDELSLLLGHLALFALGIIDGGQKHGIAVLLTCQGGVVGFGYLTGYAEGRVLATRKEVGTVLGQEVTTDVLEVDLKGALLHEALQLHIVVGSFGVTLGEHQVLGAVDDAAKRLGDMGRQIGSVSSMDFCSDPKRKHIFELRTHPRIRTAWYPSLLYSRKQQKGQKNLLPLNHKRNCTMYGKSSCILLASLI